MAWMGSECQQCSGWAGLGHQARAGVRTNCDWEVPGPGLACLVQQWGAGLPAGDSQAPARGAEASPGWAPGDSLPNSGTEWLAILCPALCKSPGILSTVFQHRLGSCRQASPTGSVQPASPTRLVLQGGSCCSSLMLADGRRRSLSKVAVAATSSAPESLRVKLVGEEGLLQRAVGSLAGKTLGALGRRGALFPPAGFLPVVAPGQELFSALPATLEGSSCPVLKMLARPSASGRCRHGLLQHVHQIRTTGGRLAKVLIQMGAAKRAVGKGRKVLGAGSSISAFTSLLEMEEGQDPDLCKETSVA